MIKSFSTPHKRSPGTCESKLKFESSWVTIYDTLIRTCCANNANNKVRTFMGHKYLYRLNSPTCFDLLSQWHRHNLTYVIRPLKLKVEVDGRSYFSCLDLDGTELFIAVVNAGWNSTLHTRQSSTQSDKYQMSHRHSSAYQSSTKSDKYQVSHRYSYFSWWRAHSRPKHVEKRNKHTKKNCAPFWLYLQDYTRM